MDDLHVSWAEYHHNIEVLAAKVHQSGWQFNQILCVAKGGLRVGDIFARIFDLPLAIMAASSYGGPNNQVRGEIRISPSLAMTTRNLGNRVLVVDDLVDSGVTLQQCLIWLEQHHGTAIQSMRTAVIWWKACSVLVPDYYAQYLPTNPWIHQPFETYERMTPAELTVEANLAPELSTPTPEIR